MKDRSWGENPFSLYGFGSGNGPAWFYLHSFMQNNTWLYRTSQTSKGDIWGAILGIGYIGMYVNLPLFIDEGFLALPLYAAGKIYFQVLKVFSSINGYS